MTTKDEIEVIGWEVVEAYANGVMRTKRDGRWWLGVVVKGEN